MTPQEQQIEREVLTQWCERQTECPVVDRLNVEYLLHVTHQAREQSRMIIPALPESKIVEAGRTAAAASLSQREEAIENMALYPLTHCWEPPIWNRIDLEVARKRLAHPGRVIEAFITGGMRPGKSFSCARRQTAHWLHTEKATVFALAETMATSRKLQQQPIEGFLPEEVSPTTGKWKATKHERFKFSGGHFTNEEFSLRIPVQDETGRRFSGGGDFVFRFFTQDISTFQGYELTSAWSDELVPLSHVKAVRERMATRAQQTKRPEFLHRIEQAVKLLEAGKRVPVALLGALYHGVHLISFTPYLGWNETVNYFLAGAVKRDWEIAPDLVGKPGVQDPRVPRFAQPQAETALVAYVFTSDNRMKPAYDELSASLKTAPESEVRIKLYGDVSRDQAAVFYPFGEHNLCGWRDFPRSGTLYEIIDPGDVKPTAVAWFMVDRFRRRYQLQEWPCESIPIDGHLPGAWAVPSQCGKINGDPGPAYKLRMKGWNIARQVREIWAMRHRLAQMFAASGEKFQGDVQTLKLEWPEHPEWNLEGEFVMPHWTIIDPRACKKTLDGVTLQEIYYNAHHGIASKWEPNACDDDEGVKLVLEQLNAESQGLPVVQVNRECTNTQFMFHNLGFPAYAEGTKRQDEVCVEWFDLWKYFEKDEPVFIDPTPRPRTGMTFAVKL